MTPPSRNEGSGLPTHQKSGSKARRKIEEKVDRPASQSTAQVLFQLVAGVFHPQHEQQEQNADLGPDLDELLGEVERRDSAFTESQPGEQVKRNGGKAQAACDACQHGEPDGCRANLDENLRDIVNRLRQRVPLVRTGWGKAGFQSKAE